MWIYISCVHDKMWGHYSMNYLFPPFNQHCFNIVLFKWWWLLVFKSEWIGKRQILVILLPLLNYIQIIICKDEMCEACRYNNYWKLTVVYALYFLLLSFSWVWTSYYFELITWVSYFWVWLSLLCRYIWIFLVVDKT